MSEHFQEYEFRCRCPRCKGLVEANIDDSLYALLEWVRSAVGHAIKIVSGVRCKEHNAEVGGVENSDHLRGTAADISIVSSQDRFLAIRAVIQLGGKRIGIGKDFLHLSVDRQTPQQVIWTYYE
jgi:zinc D-Ala-D-Ala carboxypeptidase